MTHRAQWAFAMSPYRWVVLDKDGMLHPGCENYSGPPGPLLGVSEPEFGVQILRIGCGERIHILATSRWERPMSLKECRESSAFYECILKALKFGRTVDLQHGPLPIDLILEMLNSPEKPLARTSAWYPSRLTTQTESGPRQAPIGDVGAAEAGRSSPDVAPSGGSPFP